MLAAAATGWEMFPTWKDLEAFSTWKDLQDYPTWNDLTDVERRAEQAQQQMWLEYSEVMQQTQAQVQALAYRLDLRLEELEAHQWLPELPPGLPQQRFIPHWSAAVGAAELAEGFPPIDLTQTEQVLVAIAKLTEEAIRVVRLEDDLPILLDDEHLDPWHMAEVGWSPNFMFAYLLYFAQNSNLVFSDLQMFFALGRA